MTRESNTHRLETALLLGLFALVPWNPAHAQCQQARLTPSGAFFQEFGTDVDISGDVAVVGAFGSSPPPALGTAAMGKRLAVGAASSQEGVTSAAYVFRREAGQWVQEAVLTASDQEEFDFFGSAVAVSGDRIAVGAPSHTHSGSIVGAVFIFHWNGTSWVEEAELAPSGTWGEMGYPVAFDGDRVLTGATSDGPTFGGSAYVFRREGTTWVEEATLIPSDPVGSGQFGWSVAINGDRAAIARAVDARVFVFRRSGNQWVEEARLGPAGFEVALSSSRLVVGTFSDPEAGPTAGSATIFRRDGTVWTEEVRLLASDAGAFSSFGARVAISSAIDELVVVGAPGADGACPGQNGCDSGAAYVFHRFGENWYESAKLVHSDAADGDSFGAVAIDGNDVIVGAPRGDSFGAAYLFSANECITSIPALSYWGLCGMMMLILAAGSVVITRRPRPRNAIVPENSLTSLK